MLINNKGLLLEPILLKNVMYLLFNIKLFQDWSVFLRNKDNKLNCRLRTCKWYVWFPARKYFSTATGCLCCRPLEPMLLENIILLLLMPLLSEAWFVSLCMMDFKLNYDKVIYRCCLVLCKCYLRFHNRVFCLEIESHLKGMQVMLLKQSLSHIFLLKNIDL